MTHRPDSRAQPAETDVNGTPTFEPPDMAGWWYRGGQWERGPELIPYGNDASSWGGAAKKAGFDCASPTGGQIYATLGLYRQRKDPYAWAIVLDLDCGEAVYTPSMHEAMAVLAQWAPAIQALNAGQQDLIIADGIGLAVDHLGNGDPDRSGIAGLVHAIAKAAR